jgi:hypothetical protein
MMPVAPDWQESAEKRADERYERDQDQATSEVSLSSAFARELRRVLLEGIEAPEGAENTTAAQVTSGCIPDLDAIIPADLEGTNHA